MAVLDLLIAIWRHFLLALGLSGRIELTMHPAPAQLVSVDAHGKKCVTGLDEILTECPSLSGSESWFTPTAWLATGHLSTIWCTIASFNYDTVVYSRELLRLPDGGTIGIDVTPPVTPEDPIDSRPILVVCHGMSGGSYESYVRDLLCRVTKPEREGGLGWRGAVVNARGSAGVKVTSNQLSNGGYTDDIRCAVTFLSHFAPDAPLYGAGFSLGAGLMAKYLGEEGEATPLKAGLILAAPWSFSTSFRYLSSTWLQLEYSRVMVSNLKRQLTANRELFENDKRLDMDAIYSERQHLYGYDGLVTAPLAGFDSAVKYYRWASADQHVHNVAVPLLSISARDDPIVETRSLPLTAAATNPNLIFAITDHGGHLGWFSGFFRSRRWISKPCQEFLRALHKADPLPRVARETVPVRVEGIRPKIGGEMILLKGEPNIGFRLVEEEIRVEADEGVDIEAKKTV